MQQHDPSRRTSSAGRATWPCLFLPVVFATACLPGGDTRDEEASASAPTPAPAAASRGSLTPVFRLLPPAEYERLGGSDARYASADVGVSAEDKIDEIAQRIAEERGLAVPPSLVEAEDRPRAGGIPFRGNPSDLLRVPQPDGDLLLVPLGGDLMTPGNEVAIVETVPALQLRGHVAVGVRPQRLALLPAGLVLVCNQYSNYVSVIDPRRAALLTHPSGEPVTIFTDYYCADLALAPRDLANPDPDRQHLYIANRWKRSVEKHAIDVVRDATGAVVDVVQTGRRAPAPLAEIDGVGSTPSRLELDLEQGALFVANHRGGTLARIDLTGDAVEASFEVGAPSVDVVSVGQSVFVPTLMPDRGLLASDEATRSALAEAPALVVTGLDGAPHEAHPGRLLDGTRSYNFEDVRNGLFELSADLAPLVYYTDDLSAEPNFSAAQKVLAGALPQALIRNTAGDRLYLALGGSDLVQELIIPASGTLQPGRSFETRERPFAISLDEAEGRLHVVAWGGEVLESFDLASGARLAEVDLGYAAPRYPATEVEAGERHYYDASWSNNGRKTCAHCHFDELISDGVGFSNGTTAPTALHRVKPNHDLLTTDSYFWNGAFDDGRYRSAAFAAQIRGNCELVLFGLIEGPDSEPSQRIGDPANAFRDAEGDLLCRPVNTPQGALPPNFDDEISGVIAAEKALAAAHVQATTGRSPDALSDLLDFYSVAELRLGPNPHSQLRALGELEPALTARLAEGAAVFDQAGCGGCHRPLDARHPFASGLDEGSGADWTARFAAAFANDPRLQGALPGGLPDVFVSSIRTSFPSSDVNVHLDPIDFFTPFCFTGSSCLAFEDPLEAGIGEVEQTRRLELLLRFNLADPDRGFVPGNVRGQVKVNVPSLRGVFTQSNLLHHGLAHSVREAILAPGHPALEPGETGYAVDRQGRFDTHGATSNLEPDEVEALVLYVNSIE